MTATAPLHAASIPALGPRELIELWERSTAGVPLDTADQAVVAGGGGATPLTLGGRDHALLELRRQVVGDAIELVATCPACGADVEVAVSCAALLAIGRSRPGTWMLRAGTYRLRLRPLQPGDEHAAAAAPSVAEARAILLSRAVLEAVREGRAVESVALPDSIADAVGAAVLAHDPLAEVILELDCPDCACHWPESFDTPRLVSEELAHLGQAILAEVDLLARTYGWSEDSILALPAARRASYVALASS